MVVPRRRWAALVLLSCIVSFLEIAGALLVVALLSIITEPGTTLSLPVLGDFTFPEGEAGEKAFIWMCGSLAGFFILRGAIYLFQIYVQNRITHNAGARLATRLLDGYLSSPYEFHLRRNSADLIRIATSAVSDVVSSVFVPAVSLLSEALIIAGILAALLLAAPVVTLGTAAAFVAIVFIALKVVQPRIVALGAENQVHSTSTMKTLQESLHSIKDIKLGGRETYFVRRHETGRYLLARAHYLRTVFSEAPRVVIETSLIILLLSFLLVTVLRTGFDADVLVTLGLFAYAGFRILPSVNRVVANLNNLRFGTTAVEHVLDDLARIEVSREPSVSEFDGYVFSERIVLRDVTFRYAGADSDVISGINLEIGRGEVIGLIGSTGGGKSTLIDLICGLLRPRSGEISIDGMDQNEIRRSWQRNLGVVSQSITLIDDTIRRNIAFGSDDDEIRVDSLRDAIKIAQLDATLAALPNGLDTVVGERGVRLSGGQRQRVAIARALYTGAPVLIFDEGTSGLDNVTEAAFIAALEELRGERTVIAAAHRLTTLRTCSRIHVLEGGRITDTGTYEELIGRNLQFQHMK